MHQMSQKIFCHLTDPFGGITNKKCFIEMSGSKFDQKIIPLLQSYDIHEVWKIFDLAHAFETPC